MKVLVVDDDKDGRFIIVKIFESNGYEVSSACNGIVALESIKISKPDIIISDIMMPEMDGFTFLHRLKQYDEFKYIPFVFYTAHYMSKKDDEFGRSLGASKFILKPKDPMVLINEIESVMAEHATGYSKAVECTIETDEEYLKQYTNRVVRKLEEKSEDLEETKHSFDTVLDNMADGVVMADPQFNITYCNNSMRKIMECNNVFDENLLNVTHKPCTSILNHSTDESFEIEIVNKKGN